MTPVPTAVRRLCRAIEIGAALFVLSVIAIYVISWAWPELTLRTHAAVPRIHLAGLATSALAALSPSERLLVAAASLPYLAALAWAFYRLIRMLRRFEQGRFFERESVSDLRAFSGLLLVSKLLALAAMHLRVAIAMHLLGPEKMGPVTINLSSDELAILLLCALFFAIAAMMEEGRKLAEENRGFV